MNTTAPLVGHLGVPRPQLPPWFRAITALLVLLLCVAALTSCTPVQAYVQADRATYEAIAPPHARYVAADASLSPEQKQDRQDLLDTWRRRIEVAEGAGDSQQSGPGRISRPNR